MEPMTLGSPGNVSPSFVPSFLMGEMATAATMTPGGSEAVRGLGTPSRSSRRVSFAPDSPLTSLTSSPAFSHPVLHTPSRLMTPNRQSAAGEPVRKGPPIVSLFDTLPSPANQSFSSLNQTANQSSFSLNQTANQNFSFNQTANQSSSALNQTANQSFSTTPNQSFSATTPTRSGSNLNTSFLEAELSDNEESQRWVTVFGFPSSMASSVLTWLSACGNVTVRHLPNSPRANWMHLRFSCPAEARRALGRDRQMLGPDTLLGVVPCADKGVMQGWRLRSVQGRTEPFSAAGGSFLFTSHLGGPSLSFTPGGQNLLNSSMRSLAASPEIAVEPSALPRKTSGVLAKTMEMVFGW